MTCWRRSRHYSLSSFNHSSRASWVPFTRTQMEALWPLLSPPTGTSKRRSRVGIRSSIAFCASSKERLIKYTESVQTTLWILTGVSQERRARLQSTLRDGRIGYVANPPSDGATTPTLNKEGQHENDSEAIARNVAALKARARAGKGKKGGRGGKGPPSASGSEAELPTSVRRNGPATVARKYSGNAPTAVDTANLRC